MHDNTLLHVEAHLPVAWPLDQVVEILLKLEATRRQTGVISVELASWAADIGPAVDEYDEEKGTEYNSLRHSACYWLPIGYEVFNDDSLLATDQKRFDPVYQDSRDTVRCEFDQLELVRDFVKRFGKVQIDDVRWLPVTCTVRQEVMGLEKIGNTGLQCDATVLLFGLVWILWKV